MEFNKIKASGDNGDTKSTAGGSSKSNLDKSD